MVDDASDPIEERLEAELTGAEKAWAEARGALKRITAEVPSGLPDNDGLQRIRNAGVRQKAAGAMYLRALERYTDFVLRGTIPDDLKSPSRYPPG